MSRNLFFLITKFGFPRMPTNAINVPRLLDGGFQSLRFQDPYNSNEYEISRLGQKLLTWASLGDLSIPLNVTPMKISLNCPE